MFGAMQTDGNSVLIEAMQIISTDCLKPLFTEL